MSFSNVTTRAILFLVNMLAFTLYMGAFIAMLWLAYRLRGNPLNVSVAIMGAYFVVNCWIWRMRATKYEDELLDRGDRAQKSIS